MTYPANIAKVNASQVLRNGDTVCFLLAGAVNEDMDASEEDAQKFAEAEVQRALTHSRRSSLNCRNMKQGGVLAPPCFLCLGRPFVENRGLKNIFVTGSAELGFQQHYFLFYFLPLVLLAYYISPKKIRNGILFFFSLVFMPGENLFMLSLCFFSTLVDYIHGFFVDKYRGTKKAKLFVVSSVIINLGLLVFSNTATL